MPVNVPFLPNSYDDMALPANGIPFDSSDLSFNWTAFTLRLELLDALVESIVVSEK